MEYASVIIVAVLGLLGNVIASALNGNKQTAVMQAEIKASNELTMQKIDMSNDKLNAKIDSSNALVNQKVNEVQKDIVSLSERVSKHNNLVERMATVEAQLNPHTNA